MKGARAPACAVDRQERRRHLVGHDEENVGRVGGHQVSSPGPDRRRALAMRRIRPGQARQVLRPSACAKSCWGGFARLGRRASRDVDESIANVLPTRLPAAPARGPGGRPCCATENRGAEGEQELCCCPMRSAWATFVIPTAGGPLAIVAEDFSVEPLNAATSLWVRLRLALMFKKKKYLSFRGFLRLLLRPEAGAQAIHHLQPAYVQHRRFA